LTGTNLVVSTDSEQGSSGSVNFVRRNFSELLHDELVAEELLRPVVDGPASPKIWVVVVGDGVNADVVTATVKFLLYNLGLRKTAALVYCKVLVTYLGEICQDTTVCSMNEMKDKAKKKTIINKKKVF
jgi:hypothetical protein